MFCSHSPTKHFFALSGSPVNYNSLNLDTREYQHPSLTSKGVTTRRYTKLPAGLSPYFNEHVFLLLRSIFALRENTWDSAALLRGENSPKIGLLRCPEWIARCCESPLEPRAPCFVLFICILLALQQSK